MPDGELFWVLTRRGGPHAGRIEHNDVGEHVVSQNPTALDAEPLRMAVLIGAPLDDLSIGGWPVVLAVLDDHAAAGQYGLHAAVDLEALPYMV